MHQDIRAIFENGLLRPLDPLSLAEHEVVSLVIRPASAAGENRADRVLGHGNAALMAALDEAESLPIEGAKDGFSGADHDLVLYGWKK